MNQLSIFINDQLAFEFDSSKALEVKQLEFLDRMNQDIDRGFKIYGEIITEPDQKQKATFAAMNLLRALRQEDHDNRIDIEFVETH